MAIFPNLVIVHLFIILDQIIIILVLSLLRLRLLGSGKDSRWRGHAKQSAALRGGGARLNNRRRSAVAEVHA